VASVVQKKRTNKENGITASKTDTVNIVQGFRMQFSFHLASIV